MNSQILQAPPRARPAAKTPNTFSLWSEALASTTRFYANKLRYVYLELLSRPEEDIETGAVRHVRASAGGVSADLPYCLDLDGRGILEAVQPAWIYLSDFAAAGARKTTLIRKLLAKLPGGVSFHFSFHSHLGDGQTVRRALAACGFKLLEWETCVYTPPPAAGRADLIDTLSGRSIKGTLRRARRDLEIVDISVRDFLHIQQSNLGASGKKSNRNDNLDQRILEAAMRRKCVRILAARRKSTEAHPGHHPIEAAAALLWNDADRMMMFWRLTYREHDLGTLKPHVDASKLLVFAAMEDAAARNFTLDTDGYTPGMAKQYALFGPGVFERANRLHCERECLWATFNRYHPAVGERLGALLGRIRNAKPGPGVPPAILQHHG